MLVNPHDGNGRRNVFMVLLSEETEDNIVYRYHFS